MKMPNADGRIDPKGATWKSLTDSNPIPNKVVPPRPNEEKKTDAKQSLKLHGAETPMEKALEELTKKINNIPIRINPQESKPIYVYVRPPYVNNASAAPSNIQNLLLELKILSK